MYDFYRLLPASEWALCVLFSSLQEVVSLNSNLNEGEAITGLTKSKHIKEKNVRNSSHFLL